MLAWALVKRIREDLACDTKEVVSAIHEMKYVCHAALEALHDFLN